MISNINVSELIQDPDFAQRFQIERHEQGTFLDGLYSSLTRVIDVYGIIQPYQPKTVEYAPNGDQITGDIKIWLLEEIFTTRIDENDSGISDIIVYKNDRYKVTYVKDWQEHGYYSAVAKRISIK
jgi:hypothetical protein